MEPEAIPEYAQVVSEWNNLSFERRNRLGLLWEMFPPDPERINTIVGVFNQADKSERVSCVFPQRWQKSSGGTLSSPESASSSVHCCCTKGGQGGRGQGRLASPVLACKWKS